MTERTLATVQQEYTQLAAKLGHTYTQIKQLEAEIPRIHDAIQALTLENASLIALQAQKDKDAAAAPSGAI